MKTVAYCMAGKTRFLQFPRFSPVFSPLPHCGGQGGENGENLFMVFPVSPPHAAPSFGWSK